MGNASKSAKSALRGDVVPLSSGEAAGGIAMDGRVPVSADGRHPGASGPRRGSVNAMTVDVEDYFQVSAFSENVARQDWDKMPCRIERNVELLLQAFDDQNVKATFFCLGWIAERYPELIRRIVESDHELASHGYEHAKVTRQSREEFRGDVRRSKALLEDIGGTAVKGYRAASFSISEATNWALPTLEEEGFLYSSSVYPIRHDHYGMVDAPRFAFRPAGCRTLIEFPITTVSLMGRNLPCGGGGYFRLLPYGYSRWAMRRVNNRDGEPCIFYSHPWEVDPEQPRMKDASWKSRFRHYTNLARMERRLRRVLADFRWDRMDRVFGL